MAEKVKTYQELAEDRAKEWAQKQAVAAAEARTIQTALRAMPDVAHPPDPAQPWGEDGIACSTGCGGTGFKVQRWTTCNGTRHRAELRCLGCGDVNTWDFGDKRWLRLPLVYKNG